MGNDLNGLGREGVGVGPYETNKMLSDQNN